MTLTFNLLELSNKVDGVMIKYNINESVCRERVTLLSSWPKIKDPKNIVKKPKNSTSHASIVI